MQKPSRWSEPHHALTTGQAGAGAVRSRAHLTFFAWMHVCVFAGFVSSIERGEQGWMDRAVVADWTLPSAVPRRVWARSDLVSRPHSPSAQLARSAWTPKHAATIPTQRRRRLDRRVSSHHDQKALCCLPHGWAQAAASWIVESRPVCIVVRLLPADFPSSSPLLAQLAPRVRDVWPLLSRRLPQQQRHRAPRQLRPRRVSLAIESGSDPDSSSGEQRGGQTQLAIAAVGRTAAPRSSPARASESHQPALRVCSALCALRLSAVRPC